MMQVGYYPGCSLEATARDYSDSLAGLAGMLEVELVELPDWNCCGASSAHGLDHGLALELAARNLVIAAGGPQELVVPCALCFSRLRHAQAELAAAPHKLSPALAAMGGDPARAEVVELNTFLTGLEMQGRITAAQKFSLEGLRPVCYHGCQGQRPPQVTGSKDYEHPADMERLLAELGADVCRWDHATDCCGASHAVARPDLVFALVAGLYARALEAGANCIVTGCQMCQANLDLYQEAIAQAMGHKIYLPVLYLTEAIALALGHDEGRVWLGRHLVDPEPMLQSSGLPRQAWGGRS